MSTVIEWDFVHSAKAIASALRQLHEKSHDSDQMGSPVCKGQIVRPQESSHSNLVEISQWIVECRHCDGTVYLSHPPILIPCFSRRKESERGEGIENDASSECGSSEIALEFDIEVIDYGAEESRQMNSSVIDKNHGKLDIMQEEFGSSCNKPAKGASTVMQYTEWTFSIVYHDVWRVPTLYFQCIHTDGTMLSRNEVLEILLQETSNAHGYHDTLTITEEELWDFVSQEEHPITGTPSFFLHPCQTTARMELLLNQPHCQDESCMDGRDTMQQFPLLSWMSMILPTVGCKISPELFCSIHDTMTRSRQSNEK